VDAEWVVRAAHLKERQAGALGVELPGGIEDFGALLGASWPIFSSRVIRESRSATRCWMGRRGFR